MKTLILLITLMTTVFSNQYTFLVDKYDKELELEAQIIYNIARSTSKKNIVLYIPKMSTSEEKTFSKYFKLTKQCKDSNFVYVKRSVDVSKLCQKSKRLFFTNNYQNLLIDKKFYGAFFWNKSRPNIVFIKERLKIDNIKLPESYEKYVEDF